jgi:hypothetical protein
MATKHLNKIIWVFGSSAAGKETFIKKIFNGSLIKLQKDLGWNEKKIIPIWESINFIGKYSNDTEVVKQRKLIIPAVKEALLVNNAVILIKGQDTDIETDLFNNVRLLFPDVEHQIIFLHVHPKTLLKRWKNKSWWKDEYTIRTVKVWLNYQIKLLSKLDNIEINTVTFKKDAYKQIKFPPKLLKWRC